MLTIKQDGKRIINPDITTQPIDDIATKESLFKLLVVECGFMHDIPNKKWKHTKDDNFSVGLDLGSNQFLFQYQPHNKTITKMVKFPEKGQDFISKFLESSRNFFTEVRSLQE